MTIDSFSIKPLNNYTKVKDLNSSAFMLSIGLGLSPVSDLCLSPAVQRVGEKKGLETRCVNSSHFPLPGAALSPQVACRPPALSVMKSRQSSPAARCLWERGTDGGDGRRRVTPLRRTPVRLKPEDHFIRKKKKVYSGVS